MWHYLQGIPFGGGAGQQGLKLGGRLGDLQKRPGIEVGHWGEDRGAAGRRRAGLSFPVGPVIQLESRGLWV